MSKKQYPIVERLGTSVVVTAHTTVEAQHAASDALGGDCTITAVEKLHEGGIGGFFATELVRVTAAPSPSRRRADEMDAVLASADDLVSSLRSRVPEFADRLLAELGRDESPVTATPATTLPVTALPVMAALAERAPGDTLTVLRSDAPLVDELRSAPFPRAPRVPASVPVTADPAPVPLAPVAAPATPAGFPPAGVETGWSAAVLRSIGVPDRVVDAASVMSPVTEGQWIVALMTVLRELCPPLPMTTSVLVGPAAANLARQLKLVSVTSDELGESVTSVAVPNVSARMLQAGLRGRQVHLVVGGAWQHLVGVPVHLVSAANQSDLLVALRVAVAWNASLGWCWVGDRYERIDEFAVVEHLRAVLRDGERAAVA